MKEIRISRMEEGQRFLKWLEKYLDAAPRSFFYKMLRKKKYHSERQKGGRQ